MKKRNHRKHLHVQCAFCEWEKCPGDLQTLAMSGFYLIHMVDAHWEFVERIHASTGYPELRRQVIAEAAAELKS